ncbi:hypothetical protein [Intrasporangium sp. DVR]|uniref:hypothetical protein n=1 Tax=Intrasporangium sp. DVR TaxID=3127867 RepID=UPI00333F3D91
MSEQLKTEPSPPARRATLLDLSLTQLVAGSLAAATAAALGSRLGVVGTITGAAVGSVVSAIASSLYTASMLRARAALQWKKAHTRRRGGPLQVPPSPIDPSSVQFVPPTPPSGVQNLPNPRGRRVLAGAAVVFALATTVLLGLQLASGTDVTGTSVGSRQPVAQQEGWADVGTKSGPDEPPATSTPPPNDNLTTGSSRVPEPAAPTATEPTATQPPAGTPSTPAEPPATDPGAVDPTTPTDPTPTQPTAPAGQAAGAS